jgi:hypothetical protein
VASDDDFAARLLDGRARAPEATLWWPRHVASVLAHAASPRSRRGPTGSKIASVAAEWSRIVPGRAAELMARHAELEAAMVRAMSDGDRTALSRIGEDLAGNVGDLGAAHSAAVPGFPEAAFRSLVARHSALLAEAVQRASPAAAVSHAGTDLRANTLALAGLTTEWAGGAA